MRIIAFLIFCLSTLLLNAEANFLSNREELRGIIERSDVVIIASPGRSASTMLTDQVQKYDHLHQTYKTHLLPPDKNFKGKILFIFSNPDKAAESALYMVLHFKNFEETHFRHVETADREWLKSMGGPTRQTEEQNLLSYDALGTNKQLHTWLHAWTIPSDPKNAQILAVKYENLWTSGTIQEIRDFLAVPDFRLPLKKPRGMHARAPVPAELAIKRKYNLGTEKEPRYAAYDDARALWELAPPFQYLEITHSDLE